MHWSEVRNWLQNEKAEKSKGRSKDDNDIKLVDDN
jgi:hypothetical protein